MKELFLDNCRASTVEGLTDQFEELEVLSMINVGLTSLKGFPAYPKLRSVRGVVVIGNSFIVPLIMVYNGTQLDCLIVPRPLFVVGRVTATSSREIYRKNRMLFEYLLLPQFCLI